METKEIKVDPNQGSGKKKEKIYRTVVLILGALVILFGVLWFTTRQSLHEVVKEREIVAERNYNLQLELDSLIDDYHNTRLEYDSILADKDSIIHANAEEIQNLIARQADYYRIRRQLNQLRDITQQYVHEMDSLYQVNEVLRAENVQMREEIQQVQRRSTALAEDKQVLETKVEAASGLRAYEIEVTPFRIRGRGREHETDRARRVEQVRVCFVVGENPITPAGEYNAYMRIADPNGNILRVSDGLSHAFVHHGDTLQFSARETFTYANRATNKCLTWERMAEFEAGTYSIALFTDEFRLGETAFTLR